MSQKFQFRTYAVQQLSQVPICTAEQRWWPEAESLA
jgi:hypothetical protein